MSEEQVVSPQVESVEDGAQDAPPAVAGAPAQVAAIQEKKESGEKLTKKEEKQLKEFKLKVNGKDRALRVDLSDEKEMQRYLQKALASDEAFSQSAEIKKAALNFIEQLKTNPRKVLSDPNIGVDLKKMAEEIMNESLQELEKSPEQKALEAAKKELEDIKKEREDEKKSFDEKEFTRLQGEHERQLESDISIALDIGGLPKTARTVRTMADMMMIALENNIDLKPQDLVPIVKKTTLSEFKDVVNSLGDDQLEDFLGKEIIGRLRKRNVAKAKAIDTAASIKPTGAELKPKEDAKSGDKITYKKFFGF